MANGSLNTVFANPKLTPWVRRLASALARCHSNSNFIDYGIPVVVSSIRWKNYQAAKGETFEALAEVSASRGSKAITAGGCSRGFLLGTVNFAVILVG